VHEFWSNPRDACATEKGQSMTIRSLKISAASAMILALAASSPAKANLIVDGGFETPSIPTGFITLPAGNSTISPWTIDVGTIDLSSGTPGTYEGLQFVDLDGTSPGQITQSFATTAGAEYVLRFVYANNPFAASASAAVSVFSGVTTILNQTVTNTGSTGSNLIWSVFQTTFVAQSTSTSLRFTSLSSAGSSLGLFLDDVSVNAVPAVAAPEPSTWALFGCGLASLIGYRRISQRKKAS
jgi:choice-of-anchor C domain-containing protein